MINKIFNISEDERRKTKLQHSIVHRDSSYEIYKVIFFFTVFKSTCDAKYAHINCNESYGHVGHWMHMLMI